MTRIIYKNDYGVEVEITAAEIVSIDGEPVASITRLKAALAMAREALEPFKAVAELMRPLGAFENWPNDKEPSTFMPGAWPRWADFRRASEVYATLSKGGGNG